MPTNRGRRSTANLRDRALPKVADPPQPDFTADDLIAALGQGQAIDGMTTRELARALDRRPNWIGDRLRDLYAQGMIEPGWAPRMNMHGTNRMTQVYRLKPKAA